MTQKLFVYTDLSAVLGFVERRDQRGGGGRERESRGGCWSASSPAGGNVNPSLSQSVVPSRFWHLTLVSGTARASRPRSPGQHGLHSWSDLVLLTEVSKFAFENFVYLWRIKSHLKRLGWHAIALKINIRFESKFWAPQLWGRGMHFPGDKFPPLGMKDTWGNNPPPPPWQFQVEFVWI